MRTYLLGIIAIFSFQLLNAQSALKDKDAMRKHSDEVIIHFEKAEFTEAFEKLQMYWPLPQNELSKLEMQTIQQFNFVAERFGEMIDSDFIKEQSLKDHAQKYFYVLKFERHMIRVMFTYYHNEKGWILNAFKWDDQYEELLSDWLEKNITDAPKTKTNNPHHEKTAFCFTTSPILYC